MAIEITAPTYPYQQFSNDAGIQPLYMRSSITGGLLDYAAYCLYGQRRYRIGYVNLANASGAIDGTITTSTRPPPVSDGYTSVTLKMTASQASGMILSATKPRRLFLRMEQSLRLPFRCQQ